jgi:hypothetical protein
MLLTAIWLKILSLSFRNILRGVIAIKTGVLAPVYLSVSWVLTVTYQLFTDTAVRALSVNIAFISPMVSSWINDNIDLIVFIYAFTWIFVLSSVIPSLLLGKKRSVLTQYVVCLSLAVLALSIQGLLLTFVDFDIAQLFSVAALLSNPILAVIYLAIPYLVMLALDLKSNAQSKNAAKSSQLTDKTA